MSYNASPFIHELSLLIKIDFVKDICCMGVNDAMEKHCSSHVLKIRAYLGGGVYLKLWPFSLNSEKTGGNRDRINVCVFSYTPNSVFQTEPGKSFISILADWMDAGTVELAF